MFTFLFIVSLWLLIGAIACKLTSVEQFTVLADARRELKALWRQFVVVVLLCVPVILWPVTVWYWSERHLEKERERKNKEKYGPKSDEETESML
tara:strand:- start:6 stop:287 length:282 start_codon:yes stop_codon:yes gene_type:complete